MSAQKRKSIIQRVHEMREFLWRLYALIKDELTSPPVKLPLSRVVWLWKHGFMRKADTLYHLDPTTIQDYVSDYRRYVKTPLINREYAFLLNNKLAFSKILQAYHDYLPEDYGLIKDGWVIGLTDREILRTCEDVLALCQRVTRLIIKPTARGCGEQVHLLETRSGGLSLDANPISPSVARQFLAGLADSLVCEYVQQHAYAMTIFPDTVNTLRLITMWDMEQNQPFIASGEHRFGTRRSIPVDNVAQGGLFCAIHLETGEIGKAGAYMSDPDFRIQWYEKHPDTQALIEGCRIPSWTMLVTKILEIAGHLPFIPYIGWDLVITRDGFKIIEGNNFPSLEGQIHGPLLVDPRVRKFYTKFQVISP